MNAAVFAAGWAENGRAGARERLDRFWNRIADVGAFSPIQRTVIDALMGNWRVDTSPGYVAADLMGRVLSPYQTNPLNLNRLEEHTSELQSLMPISSAVFCLNNKKSTLNSNQSRPTT